MDTGIPRSERRSVGSSVATDNSIVSLIAFGTIAVGGAGCVWGGFTADRLGRERLVTIALAASEAAVCSSVFCSAGRCGYLPR
jgi:MFS family permease